MQRGSGIKINGSRLYYNILPQQGQFFMCAFKLLKKRHSKIHTTTTAALNFTFACVLFICLRAISGRRVSTANGT